MVHCREFNNSMIKIKLFCLGEKKLTNQWVSYEIHQTEKNC